MPKGNTVQEVLVKLLDGTDCVATYTNGHIIIRKQTSGTSPERKSHVTGTIVDATGEPVIGANVVVKGTANGTITDIDGNFSLEVPEGSVLLVSYIGYANQEVKVGKQTKLSIALREDSEALDEVVVVGYTKQKKGLLTGSVVNMSISEDLEKLPTTSAGNLLVGKIAGVNVSTPTAIPGKNPDISIRTGSSWNSQGVLYVIDGMVRGGGDFNNLSPSEIEDITILKDAASAAIYGSRSEGGVVLVTTKKGKIGKPTFNYSYGYSFDSRTKNQEFTSAVETFELYNRINGASPNADFWSQDELDYLKTINGGWGYDHLGQAYRNPTTQTHNLTVS
ncbi:MAG: carboxypeptidase-like regulatory domain-containing protein, partial [Phocaeicola sp.]|nr:carboxypeptidase-like regulatory domain-containing protein [Phocaeicola sp.]